MYFGTPLILKDLKMPSSLDDTMMTQLFSYVVDSIGIKQMLSSKSRDEGVGKGKIGSLSLFVYVL